MEQELLEIIADRNDLLLRCDEAIGQLRAIIDIKSEVIEVLEKTIETQKETIELLKELNKFKP